MRKIMKKLLVLVLALTMVTSNSMASFATEATEGSTEEVICTGSEDCVATEHVECCVKYVAPVVVCEAEEDCQATEHIEGCVKYVAPVVVCEATEDCQAIEHIEGCEKYVVPCTNNEDCLAEEHVEGCPADVIYLPCPVEGCELVAGHEGECTGQVKYETPEIDTEAELANALAAGGEVTLGGDVEVTTITIPSGTTATLNLGEYTITGGPSEAAGYAVIVNNGNLTINGTTGAIVCDHKLAGSTSYAVNTITNFGTLVVNGGTIENKSTASNQIGYAIDNNSTIYDVSVTINGGTVKASGSSYYDGIRQFCNNTTKANSVEVKSGSVSTIWLQNPSDGNGERNTKDVKGTVSITGGRVDALYLEPSTGFAAAIENGNIGSVSRFETSEGRDVIGFITGGTFDKNPSEFVAVGYEAKEAEGKYVVQEMPYVAQIGDEKYKSLQDAINEADGKTVTIIGDIEITNTVNVALGKTVTLNLNGYSITGKPIETKAYAVIENKGNLTITGEGSVICDHTLTGSTSYAVNTITNLGTLVVNGGTIENKSTASNQIGYAIDNNSTSYDAKAIINGGTVKASGSSYYDGIRQFCNNTTKANSVEVKSGSVSTIWLQNPSDGNGERNTKDVKGTVSITGGRVDALYLEPSINFKATITSGYIGSVSYNETAEGRDLVGFITGGYFVKEPKAILIKEGLSALLTNKKEDGVSYIYEIGVKPQGEPEKAVTPAKPEVNSKIDINDETVSNEVITAVTQITNPEPGKGTTSFESTLPEASDVATDMNNSDHTEAVDSLNATLGNTTEEEKLAAEKVTIHVRPYLDVQVEDIDIPDANSTDAPEVTLNIEMKYDVVASTESDAEAIVTKDDVEEGEEDQINSVVTKSGETLDVEQGTPVEITVPLPTVFTGYTDTIIVKHVKDDGTVYYYDAVVNADGTITFINPNGFSTFIITADTRIATVEFETSDSTTTTVIFRAPDVNTGVFPLAEKAGYVHTGWTFANVPGTYSGKLTDNLLTLLSALFNQSSAPIVATPVFVEVPTESGGSSSNDFIAEEEKTEKPVETDSVGKETVEAGKDELGTLIGDSYGLYKLALSVKLEGELDKATNIKIKVDGVTKADSVIILQKTADGWKAVPAEAGNGYVIGKFTSLSEVLIFVNENGEVEAAKEPELVEVAMVSKPASTGDSANTLAYVGMIAVAAVALVVLYFRRRRV